MIGYLKDEQNQIMAMLRRDIKLITISFTFIIGCSQRDEKIHQFEKDIYFERQSKAILQSAKDTISSWLALNLNDVRDIQNNFNWSLDGVYFNKEKNRAFLMVLKQRKNNQEYGSDDLEILYLEKHLGGWEYYLGENLIILRENYNWDIARPMTFEKLKEISRAYMVDRYFKNKWFWEDKFQINENSFENSFKWLTNCYKKAHRAKIRCYCNDSHFALPRDTAALHEFEYGHHPAKMEDCPQ